jgi:hypothetical protein
LAGVAAGRCALALMTQMEERNNILKMVFSFVIRNAFMYKSFPRSDLVKFGVIVKGRKTIANPLSI